MMIFFATLVAVATSVPRSIPEGESVSDWALSMYGPEIVFDVTRNGRKIGTHSVEFKQNGDTFIVETETKLKVKFLFFTAYKFQYDATEVWQEDQLVDMRAVTNDGGNISDYKISFLGTSVAVEGDQEQSLYETDGPIYPTNHWYPKVLSTSSVFNTISGKINEVQITPGNRDVLPVGAGSIEAFRFTYTGDLHDVDAWYDEYGRWVGLRFKGRDGSDIVYKCVKCGAS